MVDIVVATRNRGKLVEIRSMFDPGEINLISLSDFPEIGEIPEEGDTFEENALSKARTAAGLTGKIAIADDSGIAVDALGGKPGVYSARFAGEGADDEKNNRKLLAELKGVPPDRRGATFVCVMAVVSGERRMLVRGECRGAVIDKPRGNLGFGYDPLFFYPPAGKTFSEMELYQKNTISHRSRALLKLKEQLPGFLAALSD